MSNRGVDDDDSSRFSKVNALRYRKPTCPATHRQNIVHKENRRSILGCLLVFDAPSQYFSRQCLWRTAPLVRWLSCTNLWNPGRDSYIGEASTTPMPFSVRSSFQPIYQPLLVRSVYWEAGYLWAIELTGKLCGNCHD